MDLERGQGTAGWKGHLLWGVGSLQGGDLEQLGSEEGSGVGGEKKRGDR